MHRSSILGSAAVAGLKSPNGAGNNTNGYFSPPGSPSSLRLGSVKGARNRSSNYSFLRNQTKESRILVVRDVAIELKRKSAADLGAAISDNLDKVSFIDLVEWIRSERLSALPHKGSKWDTVLIRALYFAERLHAFESTLKGHAADSELAAHLGYGHIRLLLELGHGNSTALDKAFALLYRTSSAVSNLLSRAEVMEFSSEVYEQLCVMYTDLLTLVVDVAVKFYRTVHGTASSSATLDMYAVFGDIINTFRARSESITELIWRQQIEASDLVLDEETDFRDLARWLAPVDRVLNLLSLDHTLTSNDLAEFTCVWFHDDLAQFIKSEDKTLLVNGPAGSGKTTLAASLAERLQRPIARKSNTTVYYSVGAVESQATTLNVVKALLHQLLAVRVGNVNLYRALSSAYITSRTTPDPVKYEDLLWHALEAVLKTPIENSKDTVLLVEGLDELVGGQSAGQALLQRLINVVDQGKGVKLIAFSQSLSLPTGVRGIKRSIERQDTHDDVHGVVIQLLAKSHHFRSLTGREQETVANLVIDTAQGSFLWAILATELLRLEKSPDTFTKTLAGIQNPRPGVEDLVSRLITLVDPSPDAKLILSWLVHAARPLTFREIESLFSVDVTNTSRTERRVDVPHLVQTLAPVLSIQEDIVRPKHPLVSHAITSFFSQGKLTTTVKDQSTDFLLRLFTFAKFTLPQEKGEPTLSNANRSPIEQNFNRTPFLEYVIRYWPWHLQHTSLFVAGKPTESSVTPEVKKAFPDSTIMPVLEWLLWDDQFPGAQEVQFHELGGNIRSTIFTQSHPSVLQSYINAATYFQEIGDVARASTLYYLIATVGKTILSVSHPIVVETTLRYLQLTETMVSTTRTEIVTRRETLYLLLIESYERQFGMRSDLVIQTRELLAELYVAIKEEHKAKQILQVETETSTTVTGGETAGLGDLDKRFEITFGKTRDGSDIKGYGHGVLIDKTKDTQVTSAFDLTQVDLIQKEIQRYIEQKDFVRAEQLMVDLWQRLAQATRHTSNTEWHQKKLDVTLSYAQFLENQKRSTEATSLLTSTWQEYQKHEMSFNEAVVSRLTKAAQLLKATGETSVALAILKHSAAYAKTFRKEDTRSISQLEEEITTVQTQTMTRSSKSTSSASSSESHLDDFNSVIHNESRSLDSSTVESAKTLTAQFISKRQWSQAVTVIESTLKRTWASFFAKSVNDVTMTTTFQKESVELAEQLAHAYWEQRLYKETEDVYVRLFRAALTVPKDTTFLEKTKSVLVSFYTKRGRPDKVIAVYQELLAVYRRVLGPEHDTTIQALYDVALKCRANARSHPYWIEYYQQIVTVLNKDTTTLHPRTLDAAIIVAESYWEDGRLSDAQTAYATIWTTFVKEWKQFKVFNDKTFVSTLYQRYYETLEETQATWETLRKVASEYSETTKAAYGATSDVSIEATVALARVLKQNESHYQQALSLYEQVATHMSQSKSASSLSINTEEITSTLSTLYTKHILHSKSSSVSSESLSRAVSVYQSQLAESKAQYGYSSEETLRSLHEVSLLQVRQKKTEAVLQELTTATTEIINKEQSTQKIHQAVTSLIKTYQATGLQEKAVEMSSELHYQLVTREKSASASFSVVEASRSSLYFLAVWQYELRKDLSITLSEILSVLTSEFILFSTFRQHVKSKAGLEKIAMTAAPLYYLLRSWNHTTLLALVERDAVASFSTDEADKVQLLNKASSTRHFVLAVLEYLGNRPIVDFTRTLIFAINQQVVELLNAGKFQEAHDVAKLVFAYAHGRNGYRAPDTVTRAFELVLLLAGRGAPKATDPTLRTQLLQVSNAIVKDVLKTLREQKINFAQVQLIELNELIAVLGDQKDYETLGSLLGELWNTREAQRNWPSEVLLNLGRRLVCARYLAGHQIKAIRLCEDIAYNLRRVNGISHPATLETYNLLAQLYNGTGQSYQRAAASDKNAPTLAAENFKKAVNVHEDVLRWILSETTGEVSGDDDDTAAAILAEHGIHHDAETSTSMDSAKLGALAKTHLKLLKLSFQRLGTWPKAYAAYDRLNADLFKHYAEPLKGVEGVEKWSAKNYGSGKAESEEGVFAGNTEWAILSTPTALVR